jgi:phosphate transport system substrate-binding protein
MKHSIYLLLAIVLLAVTACGGAKSVKDTKLAGAGATFPLPFYNLAFKTYKTACGVDVTYGGIGSGGGIRSLKDKVVDFAASDAFLSDDEMKSMPAVVHVPTCMGAVVLAYNLKGVNDLKLTGDIVADIYLGKIKKWNDSRIAAINAGLKLPDKAIVAVYRSDGSGTTFVFSDYLTKVSPTWKSQIGSGKSLKWPVGIASKGNPGVAGTISQTDGALGYVGSEYAFAQKIQYASLQNAAGKFIKPSLQSISAAASGDVPNDTRCMITNSSAAQAYPISCFTWLLVYKEQNYGGRTLAQATSTLQLLQWIISPDAQKLTSRVNYAPLPAQVVDKAKKQLQTVTFNGKQVLK